MEPTTLPPPLPSPPQPQKEPTSGMTLKPAIPAASQITRIKKTDSSWAIMGLLVIILLAAGIAIWWFFTHRAGPTEQKIVLTYWGLHEPEAVVKPLFDQYMAANPNILIKYINSSPPEYRQRLMAQLNSEVSSGPDIFRFHNTWVPMLKEHLTTIPDSIYTNTEFDQLFYPVAQSDLKRGVGYVGIPLMIDGLGLFYNEDLFIAANLEPPIAIEWAALRDLALKLKTTDANKNLLTGGVALGLINNVDHWQDIVAVMMMQAKANLAAPTGEVALNPLNFYSVFSKTDKVWDATLPNSTQAFATGKVALYFGPAYEAVTITELSHQHQTPIRFKVAPIPQLPEANVTWASYWVEGVSVRSPKPVQAAAWDLLKYLSQRDTMEQLYKLQQQTKGYGTPYSRKDLADQLKDHPQLGAFVLQAPAARSWYLASNTTDKDGLNDKINQIYSEILTQATTKTISDSALKKIAPKIQTVLKEFGITGSTNP